MANGYSSTERRANVRKQLRDRKGRWIEMGLKVRFSLNSAYAVGEVTGIDGENDEVSVKTPDGTVHKLGSKQLESIGAKATIPENQDTPEERRDNKSEDQEQDRKLTREEIDAQLLDLELEEDVLREEGGDKERAREIQKERLELQKKRADLNTSEREERDRSREKEQGRSAGDGNSTGSGDDERAAEDSSVASEEGSDRDQAGELDLPDNGDDEASAEKSGGGLPNLPDNGDDESSLEKPGKIGPPNLPEQGDDETTIPHESIDILDIDGLDDGDTVILVDPINGPEDVSKFLREDGIWTGSNDFEDLELDSDALKDYIESRDPRDLLVERPQTSESVSVDTPVGTRVSFTLGGADGTGRITAMDASTDTAEVSVAEGTVELPIESLTVSVQAAEDGPSDIYTPPAVPFSQQIPDSGRTDQGPLTADEQFAYNDARARLDVLLGRENRQGAAAEIEDLETLVEPLHKRALEEFSGTLEDVDSAAGTDTFPVTDASFVSAPTNGSTDLSSRAAELYGPSEPEISSINADLRAGYADDDVLALQDKVLNSEITDNVSLFRGEYVPIEVAAQIIPGRALRNDSFMALMKSSKAVDGRLARVVNHEDTIGKVPVSFRIEAEAGAPGVDLSAQPGHAQEVLLPAGVELVVTDVGWDEDRGKLNVVASYDGTSVASMADLTTLEANPLKNADTTLEDLSNALQQTNEEVNRHQFTLAAARLSGEGEDTSEDERKLARARAVRDSVAALISVREASSTKTESPAPERITDAASASALANAITGTSDDEQAMRSALESVASTTGATAFAVQRDGEVTAAIATVDSRDAGAADYVLIGYLGAKNDEDGAAVLEEVLRDAAARNRGVLIEPTPSSEDYWTQEQGFVPDPFELGASANGLTPVAVSARVEQGPPNAEPVPAHSSGLDIPTGAEEAEDNQPDSGGVLPPGSEIQNVQDLFGLPEQAWVGMSSATGPTELYQKDADGTWVSDAGSEDDLALTDQELFALASDPSTVIWFEEISDGVPKIESVPTGNETKSRISEGDEVSTSNGELSGVVERIEPDGEHVHVRDSSGTVHRLPMGFLSSPNPSPNPTPGPLPNPSPTPGTGEGEGTPNPTDLRQRDGFGRPFASDGSGLALYVGFEVMDSQDPEYFGKIISIEEDGEHVSILGEDGTKRRRKAEDLDLAVSIEMELEE